MRIWRVDGVEQTSVPQGILIARDGKSTPSAPDGYPHRVEILDTQGDPPTWRVICNNRRNYEQELAEILHAKFCHSNHTDGCGWDYETWGYPSSHTRIRYLDKARALLGVVSDTAEGIPALEAYQAAVKIVGVL
jgi:hypothetical protein